MTQTHVDKQYEKLKQNIEECSSLLHTSQGDISSLEKMRDVIDTYVLNDEFRRHDIRDDLKKTQIFCSACVFQIEVQKAIHLLCQQRYTSARLGEYCILLANYSLYFLKVADYGYGCCKSAVNFEIYSHEASAGSQYEPANQSEMRILTIDIIKKMHGFLTKSMQEFMIILTCNNIQIMLPNLISEYPLTKTQAALYHLNDMIFDMLESSP